MNNLLVEDLKQDFLEEVSSFLGACSCGNKKCKSVVFEAIGVSSNFQYVIEYDSDPQGFSNMLIYVKKGELVVFNGRCNTESDIAQILRMVII